jgi:ribosomal-protein-alanine N-acetyltransferase
MQALEFRTERMRMVAATAELLRLELEAPVTFAARLNAALPEDWPPGEWDRGAIQFFLEQLIAGGDSTAGWYSWYLLLDAAEGDNSVLAGCGGYFGPPDEAGQVEIGYSLCTQWRGQGLVKEALNALIENAWRRGAQTVVAHSDPENAASIGVLHACGFQQLPDDTSPMLLFSIRQAS